MKDKGQIEILGIILFIILALFVLVSIAYKLSGIFG